MSHLAAAHHANDDRTSKQRIVNTFNSEFASLTRDQQVRVKVAYPNAGKKANWESTSAAIEYMRMLKKSAPASGGESAGTVHLDREVAPVAPKVAYPLGVGDFVTCKSGHFSGIARIKWIYSNGLVWLVKGRTPYIVRYEWLEAWGGDTPAPAPLPASEPCRALVVYTPPVTAIVAYEPAAPVQAPPRKEWWELWNEQPMGAKAYDRRPKYRLTAEERAVMDAYRATQHAPEPNKLFKSLGV